MDSQDNLESAVRQYRIAVHGMDCECNPCRKLLKILVSPDYALRKSKLERCGHEFALRDGYFCQLPKGHAGEHWSECPNAQFSQKWPD